MKYATNLLRHDFEQIAENLSNRVISDGAILVHVSDLGRVKVAKPECIGEIPPAHIVGTYVRGVQVETIEGDLLARLRELQA